MTNEAGGSAVGAEFVFLWSSTVLLVFADWAQEER